MKRKTWLIAAIVALLLLVLCAWRVHPYLAITEASGSRTVVVEGWLPVELIPAAAAEIWRRGYDRIYTTGTLRPFAYYLDQDEALVITLNGAVRGELMVNASGIDGARMILIANGDTIMDRLVTGSPTELFASLTRPSTRLELHSRHPRTLDSGTRNLFIKDLRINGRNMHGLPGQVQFLRASGALEPGWPTFAEAAAARLVRAGIPRQRITAVPSAQVDDSRTLANAGAFAARARQDGLDAVDVLSMGVHARRSRRTYQDACGGGVLVGVVALPDPATPANGWWRSPLGCLRVAKELVGLPASQVLNGTVEP
jgi:hypothetical protein